MDEVIIDIIANVTGFMTYFAPGYIFISGFNYAAYLQRETEKEYLIVKCISASYLLYTVTDFVGEKVNFSDLEIQFATFISAILLGFVFGRLHRTNWINSLSQFFFERHIENNMFVDLWEKSNNIGAVVCVTLTMKNHMGVYVGQISEVFLYDSPQMWISYYACYDYKMNLISDYSNKKNAKLLVNYSDVEKFEFEFV